MVGLGGQFNYKQLFIDKDFYYIHNTLCKATPTIVYTHHIEILQVLPQHLHKQSGTICHINDKSHFSIDSVNSWYSW